MSKYVFPAVFEREDDGSYSVDFPDVPGCFTCGDDLGSAMEMAEDALALMLYHYEQEGREIPEASELSAVRTGKGAFATLIKCDTIGYQRRHNNKAIKKTLTIPEWLNEAATDKGLNFSQVLQEALCGKLGIK